MSEQETSAPAEEVNIEVIMQEIRKQILAKKSQLSPGGQPVVRVEGSRFPPEFYEHLYQAGLAYDQLQVKLHVSKTAVPIIGPVLQWVRQKIHELVLFYVNKLAASQIKVNTHLLRALSILSEELEAAEASDSTQV
ncbi:MAG: hypothetical protein ACE5E7_06335 [Anaerolineae bacterium]